MPDQVEPLFDVELTGCRPEPLGSYLKALGVLRLVAEQKDKGARGFWRGETFVLCSKLDVKALTGFLIEEWSPTPVIAPWNGASGFYPKDNRAAGDAITASDDRRLSAFRASINIARSFLTAHAKKERPTGEDKRLLLMEMRARLPDQALAWLDAAILIGDDRLLFPPLLGSGGNDGHLDFSNNFQQRVLEVLASGMKDALESSLFGSSMAMQFKGVMGQYHPAANNRSNPWDFILLIEGSLVFAAAATRRYESASPAKMAFPFHARAAGGLATIADSDETESRDELWLPLWSSPITMREVRQLFSEGRATVGAGGRARDASSALDFARAVTALGVDRGIDAFIRIGFHVRNGRAYFATPLGRFATGDVRAARLLDDIDGWFEQFRRKSSAGNVPIGVSFVRRRLEQAMFGATRTGGALGSVLLELGETERALGQSLTFVAKAFLAPIPLLPSGWGAVVANDSVEQRLAAALAGRPEMRSRLVPIDRAGRSFGRGDEAAVVFTQRPLVENLHALLLREDIESMQQERSAANESRVARCSLTDIARFINEDVDDVLIERWLRALVLIDGGLSPEVLADDAWAIRPPASFAVLALVHNRRVGADLLPRTAGVLARACAGDAEGATEVALRRLNALARPLPVRALVEPTGRTRRIAAALAFPFTIRQRRILESMVLPTIESVATNSVTIGSLQE